MPDEHQARIEIALSSCQGSAGSTRACGKVRLIQSWIATFSVSGSPSTMSSGTLCLGLSFRYSGDRFWPLRKSSARTSKAAFASVSVT